MTSKNPALAGVYAALYSFGLSVFTVLSTMAGVGWSLGAQNGGFNDFQTFLTFMSHAWFGGIMGLIFQIGPYARAQQGYNAQAGKNAGVAANVGMMAPPEQNQPK